MKRPALPSVPLPAPLRSKQAKIVGIGLFVVFLYALPILDLPIITTPDSDFGGVLYTMATYVLVALGLNIVIGYAGLLDLGYVGFYAIGAYVTAVLGVQHGNWPYLLTIPVAVAVTMISGVILGAPTLRVRGDYLAIVTLGFGEIIRLAAKNSDWLGGARGIQNVPKPPSVHLFDVPHLKWENGTVLIDVTNKTQAFVFGFIDYVPYYWMALTVVFIVLIADVLIKSSRVGRAWEATREDEDVAEVMGVPTFRYKLLAFAMGAFVGGLSGAISAAGANFIYPDSYQITVSIIFVAAIVIGGQGNRWGVMLGAALVVYLPERFRGLEEYRILMFGIALMLLATFRPQGLLPPRVTRRAKKLEREIEDLETGDEPQEVTS
ncbi:MAG TPA: branched-chain amino acid ABC transporter permease [Nocardioides sp.]|uniref:branched-chain amino acid ABC transporter permease n=1 Tax=Nocardioides sp. TaxID=35761 RepID=UPI002F416CA8